MSNDLFSQFDDTPQPAARAVALILIGVAALISSVATAAFFFTYGASMFDFLSPTWSPWLAALTGVFLLEGASFAWSQVGARHADTREQLTLANVGKWLAMTGSVLTTVTWFSLQSSLIAPRLDDGATFAISALGGGLIIVASSGQFLISALYASSSAQHREASSAATLRALRASAKHLVDRETTSAALTASVEEIRRGIPQHADAVGRDTASRYLVTPRATPARPTASVNGRE